MKLPVTAWKNTLSALGYRVIRRKVNTRKISRVNESSTYGSLEPRKMLATMPDLGVISSFNVDEGQTFTVSVGYTDPDVDDTHTATINWGDGTAAETVDVDGGLVELDHDYDDDGTYQATLMLTDSEQLTDQETFDVTVNNVAPVVHADHWHHYHYAEVFGTEAGAWIGGAFIDPSSSDSFTAFLYPDGTSGDRIELDSDDIYSWTSGGQTVVTISSRVNLDNGQYDDAVLRLYDDDGGFGERDLSMTITNTAPTLLVSSSTTELDEGGSFTLDLAAIDPGDDTISQWTVDWGDGSVVSYDGTETSVDHVYTDNGEYQISVTATDEDGTYAPAILLRDVSFGDAGSTAFDFAGGTSDYVYDAVEQSDGKILVAGRAYQRDDGGHNFALSRYHADGSVDTDFGEDGTVLTDLGSSDYAQSIAVQELAGGNSRILVTGYSGNRSVIAAYTDAGVLDASFSDGGKLILDLPGVTNETLYDVSVQPDGKIIAAGRAYVNSTNRYDFTIIRLNIDGDLDTSFGGDGIVSTNFGSVSNDYGYHVAYHDGKLIVAGQVANNFGIARYNADGSLDSSFGGDGLVTTDLAGSTDYVEGLLVQEDGKVVVGGYGFNGSNSADFALIRYNVDGSIDENFGDQDGIVLTNINGYDRVASMTTDAEGRILLGGYGGGSQVVVRYDADGNLDTDFGVVKPGGSAIASLVTTQDGNLLVVGSTTLTKIQAKQTVTVNNVAPVVHADHWYHYHYAEVFGTEGNTWIGGAFIDPSSSDTFTAFLYPDGTAGESIEIDSGNIYTWTSNGQTIVTFSSRVNVDNGQYDDAVLRLYDDDGGFAERELSMTIENVEPTLIVSSSATEVDEGSSFTLDLAATDPGDDTISQWTVDWGDGSVVFYDGTETSVDHVYTDNGEYQISVTATDEDGSYVALTRLDATFGNSGFIASDFAGSTSDYVYDAVEQPDGKILVSGRAYQRDEGGWNFALSRYLADGSVDTDFGDGGTVLTDLGSSDYAQSIAVQQLAGDDFRILLTGYSGNRFAIAAYTDTGNLDTSFSSGGKFVLDLPGVRFETLYDVSVQPDGKVIAAGRGYSSSNNYDFTVVRLDADGSLDTSFGGDGIVTTNFGAASHDYGYHVAYHDGKLIVAGQAANNFGVARYNADGTLDSSFGGDGLVTTDLAGSSDNVEGLLVQEDGKIVVGGYGNNGSNSSDFALVRYNVDGSIDTSFGDQDGIVLTNINGYDRVTSMTTDAEGRILLGGYSGGSQVVVRYDADGNLDGDFGVIESGGSTIASLVATQDGSLLVVGTTTITKLHAGRTVTVNNVAPVVHVDHWHHHHHSEVSGNEGNVSIAGNFIDPSSSDTFTAFLYPDGEAGESIELDSDDVYTWTSGGLTYVNVYSQVSLDNGQYDDAVLRLYDDDGGFADFELTITIDNVAPTLIVSSSTNEVDEGSTFTLDLAATDPGDDTISQWTVDWGDGSVVSYDGTETSVNHVYTDNGDYQISVTATDEDGSYSPAVLLDASFGDGGVAASDFAGATNDYVYDAVEQPDGKILVAGRAHQSGNGNWNFALSRYNADGSVDTDFGDDGTVLTDLGATDQAYSVAIQQLTGDDFRILLTGIGGNRSAIVAYTDAGVLDSSFSGGGKLLVDLPGMTNEILYDVSVQPDGKIIATGRAYVNSTNRWDFTVIRLDADGNLDTSFGGDGIVSTNFGAASNDYGYHVAYHDGKLIVAGQVANNFGVARYNADGTLDSSFGGDGLVTTDLAGSTDYVEGLLVQQDGKVVVGGYGFNGTNSADFALVRYNVDGSVDESFGDQDGIVLTNINGYDRVTSMTTDAEGRILLGGSGGGSQVVVRYDADGNLDADFGVVESGGSAIASLVATQDESLLVVGTTTITKLHAGRTVTVNNVAPVVHVDHWHHHHHSEVSGNEGNVSIAGNFIDPSSSDTFTAFLYPDGEAGESIELDSDDVYTWTSGGLTYVNVYSQVSLDNGQYDDAVLRLYDDDGGFADFELTITIDNVAPTLIVSSSTTELDEGSSFTLDLAATDPGDDTISQWTVDWGDGSVVSYDGTETSVDHVYTDNGEYQISVTATDEDGSYVTSTLLDATFGNSGFVASDFAGATSDFVYDSVEQPDGKILVAGRAYQSGSGNWNFALSRYLADGSVDTDFGDGGTILTDLGSSDYAYSVEVQQLAGDDFRIFLTGYSGNRSVIAAYTDAGVLDTSFGVGGKLVLDLPGMTNETLYDVTFQPDGKIIAAGRAYVNSTNRWDFTVIRLNADGNLDTSFGGDGIVSTNFGAASNDYGYHVAYHDGKLIVAGQVANNFGVARYNADGSLDSSFGGDGLVTTDLAGSTDNVEGLLVQENGKIVVGGYGNNGSNSSDFALVRYNVDGSLDTSFGDQGGVVLTDIGGYDRVASMTTDAEGRILLGGYGGGGQVVVRYDADGNFDTDFGVLKPGGSAIGSLVSTQDGNLLVVGSTTLTKFQAKRTVTVNNVAPVIHFIAATNSDGLISETFREPDDEGGFFYEMNDERSVKEGTPFDIIGRFSDPSLSDGFTITFYPDGNPAGTAIEVEDFTFTELNGEPVVNFAIEDFVFEDNGNFSSLFVLSDDDGGTQEVSLDIVVSNVAPVVSYSSVVDDETLADEIQEGRVAYFNAGFIDPSGLDTYTAVFYPDGVNGDGVAVDNVDLFQSDGQTLINVNHSFTIPDDGPVSAVIRLTDDDGGYVDATFSSVVENVAPTVNLSADATTIDEGQSVTLTVDVTDLGDDQVIEYRIDWGDSSGVQSYAPGDDLSHIYNNQGNFQVSVSVVDEDGVHGPFLLSEIITVEGSVQVGDYTFRQTGGSADDRASADDQGDFIKLTEGDSFNAELSRTITIQGETNQLLFSFSDLMFDNSGPSFTSLINDGFEIALLDDDGNSLVPTIGGARDSFFNITENAPGVPVLADGVTYVSDVVSVDVSDLDIPTGTNANVTVVFRLVNNDNDTNTMVKISTVESSYVLWGTDDDTGELFSFRRYADGTSTEDTGYTPYGSIQYDAGTSGRTAIAPGRSGTDIEAFTITNNGTAYFVANRDIFYNDIQIDSPVLFAIDLNDVEASPSTWQASIVGRIEGGDDITALALNPANGDLLALVQSSGTDELIRLDDLSTSAPLTAAPFTLLGSISGSGERSTTGEDMVFGPEGKLYLADNDDDQLYEIDASNGAILSVVDTNLRSVEGRDSGDNIKVEGLAFDPLSGDLIASSTQESDGEPDFLFRIKFDAAGNVTEKTKLFEVEDNGFNLGDVEGMAFITVETTGLTLPIITPNTSFVDFPRLVDVTDGFEVRYENTSLNSETDVLFARHTLENLGTYSELQDYLLVGVTNISDPSVTVHVPDGTTPGGIPFFNVSSLAATDADGFYTAGTTENLELRFDNPQGIQFTYDIVILSAFEAQPGITLIEDTDLITTNETEPDGTVATFVVPADPGHLRINFSDLIFDSDSGDPAELQNPLDSNDAFEIVVRRRSDGLSILPTIGYRTPFGPLDDVSMPALSNSQFNLTQGQSPLTANGVVFNQLGSDTGEVLIDISTLTPGTELEIIARLLNNDADDDSQVTVSFNLDAADQGGGESLTSVSGNRLPESPRDNGLFTIDVTQLDDVTADFDVSYTYTTYDNRLNRLHLGLNLTKAGGAGVRDDLLLAVRGLTDQATGGLTNATLAEFDGALSSSVAGVEAGTLYLRLSSLLEKDNSGFYVAGASLEQLGLTFDNVQAGERFDYDLVILGNRNLPPTFTSNPYETEQGQAYPVDLFSDGEFIPILEIVANNGNDNQLIYTPATADPNNDDVVVSIVTGPTGLELDSQGRLIWTPGASDVGTHSVRLEATDEHGAHDPENDQLITIRVVEGIANRPPRFNTDPVTAAEVGQLYTYDSGAFDADGDELTYTGTASYTDVDGNFVTLDGSSADSDGFTVVPSTGEVTWTPPVDARDQTVRVTLHVEDGQGASSFDTQVYDILVNDPNRPPIITNLPATHYVLPGETSPIDGDVNPDELISVQLGLGDTLTLEDVLVRLPNASGTDLHAARNA